jgi:hypothetical protein
VDATPEEWKSVPGYEGQYEVSDLGKVRSLDRSVVNKDGIRRRVPGVMLKPGKNALGYFHVALCKDGVPRSWKVHQLVALAFIGPRPEGMDTCHTNDIRTDNRAVNLRYDTHSENARDHVRAGNHYETKRTHCPRKHVLAEPNLRSAQWAKGLRACLACHRASGWVQKNPLVRAPLMDQVADERYRKIMENEP